MVEDADVAIVGAGPVGLYLGCRLARLGLRFVVLEKRFEPITHSRSIGIHPPALERFEALGVVEEMLAGGVTVRRGRAFAGTEPLGVLDFSSLAGPYPFVLTLPQFVTESILERRLEAQAPGALLRGAEVVTLATSEDNVAVRYRRGETESALTARLVVGCDGKDSIVRRAAGIAFRGGPYPDSYLMGDFADTTELGTDAAIYLTNEGLVESFPLPGSVRRWVAKTDRYMQGASASDLSRILEARLGYRPAAETNSMLSAFGVQHYLASSFSQGRLVLAGDAAHVLSPIGGQGMNLGWLDAALLAEVLALVAEEGKRLEPLLALYDQKRRRAARRAIRQAEFNMAMGRKTHFGGLRNTLVWTMLNTPLEHLAARAFTMRWL